MIKRILVVEDDASIRDSLLDLLDAEDFEARGADNGLTGLRSAREFLPDLIVCDIMMPELDGFGVFAELQKSPATAIIPFIFLTAKADRADLRRGMSLGADDYVTKPFTRTEILQAIQARLARIDLRDRGHAQEMTTLRESIALALPHELRTPLSGIKTGASVIMETGTYMDMAEIKNVADIIHQSAERLERLIVNYLTYAELEVVLRDPARIAALRERTTGFSRLVIRQMATDQAARAKREADLKLDLADTPIRMADLHLAKLAEELADNAFKFSQPGTPVHIATRVEGRYVYLTVNDLGRGLTLEQISQVGAYMQFERKLHEQQGSGLGLAIARNLADIYGGELTIQSTYGQNTTVTVRLLA